ncbi:MAG: cation transporter [Ruminococcaceae bacterium]|nr:cation transporter [Oscillospiraceae bacterium]
MKTEKKLLIAFILNLSFSVFELVGGIMTGSVAIFSDAIHDVGDAVAVGLSYLFERKSKRNPDKQYTYGYGRFSVIGGGFTTLILIFGSITVVYYAVERIFRPVEINYDGMILFAVVGTVVNLAAVYVTRSGDSVNQKAVNLHMLEDVLGWVVVLIGAVLMRFTNLIILDSIMSVGISLFILKHAISHLISIVHLFCEKVPKGISVDCVKEKLSSLSGVLDVHHIHIWSIDGEHHCATMHIVTKEEVTNIKLKIRETLKQFNITHITIETEREEEFCGNRQCLIKTSTEVCCDCHQH